MKIAAIQSAPIFLDSQATTEKALTLMREAAGNGARLCVFPEVFISGYPVWVRPHLISKFSYPEQQAALVAYLEAAIAVDGEEMSSLCREAARLDLFTYMGFLEPAMSGGTVYASLAAIHPARGLVSVHRKLRPTYHERMVWCPGDGHGLQVHEWHGFKVGGLSCFENWMPLARYTLYAQGEQLHVAAWPGKAALTRDISRFIAMEGRVYVASAGGLLYAKDIPDDFPLKARLAAEQDCHNSGGTIVVEPDGIILAEAAECEETILYADLDVRRVRAERAYQDPAGHYGRPDVFSLGVNRDRQVPFCSVYPDPLDGSSVEAESGDPDDRAR